MSRLHVLLLLSIFALSSDLPEHEPAQVLCCAQKRHPRLPSSLSSKEGLKEGQTMKYIILYRMYRQAQSNDFKGGCIEV